MSESLPPEAWKAAAAVGVGFLDKIASFIGDQAEPRLIVKRAIADAKAKIITAEGEIAEKEMRLRAEQRLQLENVRNQANIESIVTKAIPHIEDKSNASNVSEDWLSSFIEKAKLASDEDIQVLWSKVLSGEANRNGKFSKRTLTIISDMEKTDALLFTNLCKFAFNIGEPTIIVRAVPQSIYDKYNINFNTLKHLQNLGLIELDNVNGYKKLKLSQEGSLFYFNTMVSLKLTDANPNDLPYGSVYLSKSGRELVSIAGATAESEILDYTLSVWKSEGIQVTGVQEMPFGFSNINEALKAFGGAGK